MAPPREGLKHQAYAMRNGETGNSSKSKAGSEFSAGKYVSINGLPKSSFVDPLFFPLSR